MTVYLVVLACVGQFCLGKPLYVQRFDTVPQCMAAAEKLGERKLGQCVKEKRS